MKRTNFLRFFCALVGIITLLSSIPVFAEDSTSTETTVTPFDVTFDFEYGKEIVNVNGTLKDESQENALDVGNISPYLNNSDIAVSTPYDLVQATTNRCFIMKNPTVDNNYALKVADGSSYFAVEDVNNKLPDGDFTVSIDVYLNLAGITNTQTLIQWIRDESLPTTGNDGNATYKNHLVRTNNQGQIVFLGTTLTNVTLSDSTWHNITVKARYISENQYEVSLFVDKNYVKHNVFAMSEPAEGNGGSCVVFFSKNNSSAQGSYMDNIHIYDVYTPDMNEPLDVTLDFDYGKEITKHMNGTKTDTTTANGLHAGNLTPYLYNPDITVRTQYDYGSGNGSFIQLDPATDRTDDYALKSRSGTVFFAVKDIYNKLSGADFTVSANMCIDYSQLTANATLPLIQYVRFTNLAKSDAGVPNRYCLVGAKCNGDKSSVTLAAGTSELDVKINDKTWYNIKVTAERIYNDIYTISLYLDDEFLTSYDLDMPAPTDNPEGSFIVFFSMSARSLNSFIDDIRIIEHAEPDTLDVALDFNTLTAEKVVQGTDYNPAWLNIGKLLNTDKFAITCPMDHGEGNYGYQTKANGNNIYLEIVSGRSYIAIEDLGNRLEKSDFAVSADMYLNFDLTNFTASTLSLLQWSKGVKLNSTNYDLISVDNRGQLVANGNKLGVFVDLNDWFNISARLNYLTDDSYEVAIYLNEDLIYVYTLDMPAGARSFIRFLGTGTSGFRGSRIDNILITQTEVGTSSLVDIWDVDFDEFENETVMNADNWSAASSIYSVVRVNGKNKVEDGRLKITATSPSTATELSIGGKGYDPILTDGGASISMKFELSAAGAADVSHSLISWKKPASEVSILGFKNNKLVFCGITLSDEIETGKECDVKVEIDGYRMLAELYVDGEKKVSSAPILGMGEDVSWTDRFSDVIGMFTSSAVDASVVYYVDDLKIERLDKTSKSDISFDFTGWSGYSSLPLSTNTIGFEKGGTNVPTVENVKGNEYLYGDGSRRFYLNDLNGELQYHDFVLEFDIYYTAGNDSDAQKNIIDFRSGVNSNSPAALLLADGNGNLIIGTEVIAEGISGTWKSIKIKFITNDENTKWTKVIVSVNGAEEKEISWERNFAKQMCFRFIPQSVATFGWDNIRLYVVEEVANFNLDFNGDYETALGNVAKTNYYPTIGSTRVGSDKNTYTSAEVITKKITVGDNFEDKNFLRIDRTYLAAAQDGYFHVGKADFIGLDEYIVEADFGITSAQGFGITPITIVGNNGAKEFTPVKVVGYYNTLEVDIRGYMYPLYSADGTLLKVKTAEENGFTKIAVLVNEKDSTYTVYVDERVAYYSYDGKYIPCAELPIHYKNTGTYTAAAGYIRVMETASVKNNSAIIDIARVAVIPSTSGLNTAFRGVQGNVTDPDGYAVRFVGGIDALYGDSVGFDVKATYIGDDGETPTTTTKTTLENSVVYSSIVEANYEKTAEELGSNYLFVMVVNKIFYEVEQVDFEIVPFVKHGGIPCYGEKVFVTVQYADNKVDFIVK